MKKNFILLSVLGTLGLLLGGLIWRFSYILHSSESIAHLIYFMIILCASVPYFTSRIRSTQALKYAAAWGSIFMVFLAGFSFKEELYEVGNKIKSNLFPYLPTQAGNEYISFVRALDGHFYIEAFVNQIPIQFLVDTGATRTTLTLYDAKRLGFDVDRLVYNSPIQTANGIDFVATVHIREIKVGELTLKDISASVSKNLTERSLLGMNFLKKIKGFQVKGNQLTLEIDKFEQLNN
ncbi:MAG: TIGR02281 family clan AA aspartic protease [Candidatus Paracaedibacteraceae bacterium]|nr:TIGR02281 family clan AA aspartic protease [Candidatus Paracaedibacteraceae bacterium]